MDALLIRKADGSYRVATLPDDDTPNNTIERRGWIANINDNCQQTGDRVVCLLEVEHVEDVWAEQRDELEQARVWMAEREHERTREACRRAVERWRGRTTGRGV